MESVEYKSIDALGDVDLLIIPCINSQRSKLLEQVDQALDGGVLQRLQDRSFRGLVGDVCRLTTNGKFQVSEIMIIGIGAESHHPVQLFGGELAEELMGAKTVAIDCSLVLAKEVLFGLMLKSYFPKTNKKRKVEKEIVWRCLSESPEETKQMFQETEYLIESVYLARELTFLPANLLPPEEFARRCKELSRLGLEVEVLDQKAMRELGLHAILSVGKGSINPPRAVIIRWRGSDERPIAFAGKGVCFDSGGINIKTENLLEMKWDKAGASSIVALMAMLAKSRAKVNVVAVIGLVENMVDGAAMKPGDVIDTKGGYSVEVVDTDNEGRLVLIDCIALAQEIADPAILIDLGTLTLETFGALGSEYAGLFCNDQALQIALQAAGEISGERLWPLPMGKYFAKQLESDAADLKNSGILGFGECGAAAEFLRAFVNPQVKWAHLDISGVAWTTVDQPLNLKGVTGYGVRLLYAWLKSRAGFESELKALSEKTSFKETVLTK